MIHTIAKQHGAYQATVHLLLCHEHVGKTEIVVLLFVTPDQTTRVSLWRSEFYEDFYDDSRALSKFKAVH